MTIENTVSSGVRRLLRAFSIAAYPVCKTTNETKRNRSFNYHINDACLICQWSLCQQQGVIKTAKISRESSRSFNYHINDAFHGRAN